MFRRLVSASACAVIACVASPAFADTTAITSGTASAYWDGSLTSFTISSADSTFTSEYYLSAKRGFNGGDTVDFSTTIPVTNGGNHPLSETYHGQQFQSWVSGSLTIVARTFVAPHADGDGSTYRDFTTTFTMTGTITAYASSDRTGTPQFSTQVTGSGTVTAGPYRIFGDSYYMTDGAEIFRFAPPPSMALPGPWQSLDIGAVGTPGYAYQGSDGDLFVGGAGSDIWDTADSFRFVYQALGGDGDIWVHPFREDNGNPFAKTGVMIRQTVDPSSPHVILDVKPDGGVEFMTRSVPNGATTFIAGSSGAAQLSGDGAAVMTTVALKLTRNGTTVTAWLCPSSGGCQTLANTEWLSGPALIGVAVTSHDPSILNNAYFPGALPTVKTLPQPWHVTDVGTVGTAGSASVSNGVFTVKGAGSDIWGAADSFTAVTQPLSGDGTLATRVVNEQNTHMFAKAGLTIGALAPSRARAVLDVKPDGGIEFMARLADGSSMSFIAGAGAAFPVWLRLARNSDRIDGSLSSDGQAWTTVGSVTMTLPPSAEAGLAVTSHDPTVLNTATFDHVSVTAGGGGGGTAAPPASDVVVYAIDVPDAGLHGAWTKASDSTSPQGIKLVTPDAGAAATTAPLANPADYVDVSFNAAAGTTYTIWLRLQALNNSKFNDSLWVQFSDAVVNGASVYPIGSTDALLVNLATDSTATSLNGWGWQNTAYWLSQTTTVGFATSGAHTLRIQVREDGVQLDQIVLSPSRFKTSPPGPAGGDTTIVPK